MTFRKSSPNKSEARNMFPAMCLSKPEHNHEVPVGNAVGNAVGDAVVDSPPEKWKTNIQESHSNYSFF